MNCAQNVTEQQLEKKLNYVIITFWVSDASSPLSKKKREHLMEEESVPFMTPQRACQ